MGTGRSQCFSNPRLRTGWAGPGVLVLSALAAEICLLSQAWVGGPTGCWTSAPGQGTGPHEDPLLLARAWTSEDESQDLGLGKSKMRGKAIALLKELGVKSHQEARKQNLMSPLPYLKTENNNCFVRSVQEYQDLTKNKGSDTKKFATTNHALPPFSYKRALLKALGEISGF